MLAVDIQPMVTPLAITIALAVFTALIYMFNSNGLSNLQRLVARKPLAEDEIVSMRVYPIKSCRGFEVQSAKMLRTGLDMDRNWMFVTNSNGEFITIRTNSRMTLIRTGWDEETDSLTISIKDSDVKVTIPAHPTPEWLDANTNLRKVVIWSEETDGWEYKSAISQPFADLLDMDIRLVYKGPTRRILKGCATPERLGRTEATKFADMMPVLVGTMASVNELNERLRSQGEPELTIEHFRPNIILRGQQPWSEDNWKTLQISGENSILSMNVVCRCLRCQVPNVDPDTAEKHPRRPWNELMKYRRIDQGLKFKPSFGMLCAPKDEGMVKVGMKLSVMETTDNHFFISPMK
ncbi:unnamed protein product [Clonostachys rosea f. rosea IK726]|jgi:uncharacterized protein YcbX|uniref:MOSC domain-containing protein n=2 Tax=Bionectria ochroleuca TaxID=29856 RepID=A0A8H7NPT3_BIOOC|nr:unnamed protein product [Clonostachys rosea f. rosea IK726]